MTLLRRLVGLTTPPPKMTKAETADLLAQKYGVAVAVELLLRAR